MKATLAAVAHERSVHVVGTTKVKNATGKQVTVTIVTDAGTVIGIQHITYELAGRFGHEIVEEVKGVGYLRGDAFILHNYNANIQVPDVGDTAMNARACGSRSELVRTVGGAQVVAGGVQTSP
ncbi:MAG: hypothetical protein WAV54_00470, partial [Acidimicrobiales bacterium]